MSTRSSAAPTPPSSLSSSRAHSSWSSTWRPRVVSASRSLTASPFRSRNSWERARRPSRGRRPVPGPHHLAPGQLTDDRAHRLLFAPCEIAVSVAAGPASAYDHALRDLFDVNVDERLAVAEGHRTPKDDQVDRAKRLSDRTVFGVWDDEELVTARVECELRVRDEGTEQGELVPVGRLALVLIVGPLEATVEFQT